MDPVRQVLLLAVASAFAVLTAILPGWGDTANIPPLANAGLPRYAAQDPVRLDGSSSYDPHHSGPLTYRWTQVSGPPLVMTDGNTATPTISGFVQTSQIQECKFGLIVSDGDLESPPAFTSVLIVPDYGRNQTELFNSEFDPGKPTIVYFGGGDCIVGYTGYTYGARLPFQSSAWLSRANIIWFPNSYSPDAGPGQTYYKYGDMLIVCLSKVAPAYDQPIQTTGWSTGGQPAVDAAIRMNETYHDPRYAVSRVTFLDATAYCRDFSGSIRRYLASRGAGEQCWIDNYVAGIAEHDVVTPHPSFPLFHEGVLNVEFDGYADPGIPWLTRHTLGNDWLGQSLVQLAAMLFNEGIVAGAYWSVIGPGRNLQLASGTGQQTYRFRWRQGHMEMVDEQAFPGRLPAPVTLAAWTTSPAVSSDVCDIVLSCHPSENAVGYQLLFGSDPQAVAQYRVISDTPLPPMTPIRELPSGETWWTVRVRDRYGSTIYGDPIRFDLSSLSPLSVEVQNARTGRKYGLVSHAVLDAEASDVVVVGPGTYEENIEFGEKPLTLRSLDPNDPAVVAGTVIRGRPDGPAVTFPGPAGAGCVLAGLTIQSKTVGISCHNAVPTIQDCVLECPDGTAVEFWWGCRPRLVGCTVVGQMKEGGDPGLVAYWRLDETEGTAAHDSSGSNKDGTLQGNPLWQPAGGKIDGALQFDGIDDQVSAPFVLGLPVGAFSVFAWIKGGAPGQVVLSQSGGVNWLSTDPSAGWVISDLKPIGRSNRSLWSQTVITDGDWHRIGVVYDNFKPMLSLYVDGVEAAETAQGTSVPSSTGSLLVGVGSKLTRSTRWSGLIDDVRIYNRAMKP